MKKAEQIKLCRSIKDSPDWLSEKFSKPMAWIDLLLLAEDGSIQASFGELAKRWKWSVTRVIRFLEILNENKAIEMFHETFHGTITKHLIALKSDDYKGSETIAKHFTKRLEKESPLCPPAPSPSSFSPTPPISSSPSTPPIIPQEKEDFSGKESQKKNASNQDTAVRQMTSPQPPSVELPFRSQAFASAWALLCSQPKWKKKSQSALNMSLKKLAKYDEDFAIMLIEDSIANDWQGVVFTGTDERYRKWKEKNKTEKLNVNALWDR